MALSARRQGIVRRRRPAVSQGFGLLEALVAMAVLAVVGTTLFSWVNQSLATASRLQQLDAEAQLRLTGLALAAGINPLLQASGLRDVGGLQVRWTSEVVAPLRSGAAGPEGLVRGRWLTGLTQLHVTVFDATSGAKVSFDLLQPVIQARFEDLPAGVLRDLR